VDLSLQEVLRGLLMSGTDSNLALNALLSDYARYHAVLAIVGGLFLLGLVVLAVFCWRRFAQAPKVDGRSWTFERTTFLCFGILSVAVGLFMILIVAANVTTVLSPRDGFAGSIHLLSTPQPGSSKADFYGSVTTWLRSGSAETPPALQSRIDDRLAWQRPKAIVTSVLLVLFLLVSALIWRSLIHRSRDRTARWRAKEFVLLLLGVVSVLACLVLMLMVMGNTQGSIAPLSLTLFFA